MDRFIDQIWASPYYIEIYEALHLPPILRRLSDMAFVRGVDLFMLKNGILAHPNPELSND